LALERESGAAAIHGRSAVAALRAQGRDPSTRKHDQRLLEDAPYAELGPDLSTGLDLHRAIPDVDDEPAATRGAFARADAREQRTSHVDQNGRVGTRVVYEPDQPGCSSSATLQEMDLNLIAMNCGRDPRRCSPPRDESPDPLLHCDCRSRWQSYWRRDGRHHRQAVGHRPVNGRSQAIDESERDPIETQAGSAGFCGQRSPRFDGGGDECDALPCHAEIRIGRASALLQRRGKVRGDRLNRRLFNLCRSAQALEAGFYLPGFTNLNVIRSDSPMARYLARSLSPSASVGGSVHTPSG
jgi:hypothetical protein